MTEQPRPPDGFAPTDPTDNRELYEYTSRWDEHALNKQRREGWLLSIFAAIGTIGLVTLLIIDPPASPPRQTAFYMGHVFFAGLIGGTVFSSKWWYHGIARGIWHIDRFAWRMAVPWQAALVATFMHVLFKSDLLGILNPAAMDKLNNTLAFGFLVGYFSDSAIAKLAEIAESLFGSSKGREKIKRG